MNGTVLLFILSYMSTISLISLLTGLYINIDFYSLWEYTFSAGAVQTVPVFCIFENKKRIILQNIVIILTKYSRMDLVDIRRIRMKSHVYKTALVILMLSFVSFAGCTTVVTDVNDILGSDRNSGELGIPVNYNKDYVEVAYNPSSAAEEETEEDAVSDTEDETKESDNNDKEDSRENDKDLKSGDDEKDSDSEETEEDTEEESDENSDNPDEDLEDESEEDTDEEEKEDDLNASMASDNFDAEFYAATYPDVVAVFGNSPEALYKHYLDYGKAEGRSCNAEEYALLNESTE